ncbi:nucleoside triphosphate pyrophosphatase [Spiribacter sp. 221]|uniref:Maf family protein n=1 Tax=Spiribacter onubensis TaxID=3122420 RepID=UPI00349F7EED
MTGIVLASSSPYRAELLRRLRLDFEQVAPAIDESVAADEMADHYVRRLAREKALAVAERYPDRIVIGSDQCSECHGQILGKPGNMERAIKQLTNASGQRVTLFTAVAVHDPDSRHVEVEMVPTYVHFRRLERSAIERYVHLEKPLDCAGAFRAEGLGIALFERIQSDDPNAIIGLPLIALTRLLARIGIVRP